MAMRRWRHDRCLLASFLCSATPAHDLSRFLCYLLSVIYHATPSHNFIDPSPPLSGIFSRRSFRSYLHHLCIRFSLKFLCNLDTSSPACLYISMTFCISWLAQLLSSPPSLRPFHMSNIFLPPSLRLCSTATGFFLESCTVIIRRVCSME